MRFCKNIERAQLINLLTGILGIYTLYFIAGLLNESILKRPHFNRNTKNYQLCDNAIGMILIPTVIAWLMASVYNYIALPVRVKIPHKNAAISAGAIVAAAYFSTLAIQRTSFPVVIMFESCSILPVVFIAVFCSRVHDPNLKLGPKKIIVALIITAGILTFEIADPQTKQREIQQQAIGILFLLFHFVAEGFLPDLQAEIKINYKPQSTQMMSDLNKWCAIETLLLAIITGNAWSFVIFLWQHPQFTGDLLIMSIVSGIGQFFVYRMLKQFKQHFVPFTISSRKILTATISIIFYGHKTNWIQMVGISIVLFTVFVQFLTQITNKQQNTNEANKQIINQLNEQKFDDNEFNNNKDKIVYNQSPNNEQIQNKMQQKLEIGYYKFDQLKMGNNSNLSQDNNSKSQSQKSKDQHPFDKKEQGNKSLNCQYSK